MNMPQLGLGTFRLQDQAAIDSVGTGLELGYRHIDTAQIYGNEAEVGQALADSNVARREVYLTTKIWTEHLAADRLAASLKDSLHKLRVEQVDLTLIHWPSPGAAVSVAESMQALLAARDAGVHITAYMPLAYGKVMSDPVIGEIARRNGATPAQVTLAWLLAKGYAVIPSSTRRENLASNLQASTLVLGLDDRAAIDALDDGGRLVSPDFAPAWN